MQIAGSRCAICQTNVGTMRDGAACATCNIVVHKACGASCPRCGCAVLQGEQAHELPSKATRIERERPTSVTVLARLTFLGVPLGMLTAVGGVLLLTFNAAAAVAGIATGVLTALCSAAVGFGFLEGREWSRRLYLWMTPLLLLADVAMTNGSYADVNGWLLAGKVGSYCLWAFLLTRPKAVRFFKRSYGEALAI